MENNSVTDMFNEPEVEKILKSNYTDGAVFHTHVSLVRPKGKFQFGRHTLEKFWTSYMTMISEQEDPIIGVAEKPQNFLPVLSDIDIKIKEDDLPEDALSTGSLYNENHTAQVIEVYQSVLRSIVDNCTPEMLTCVLLEKEPYFISGYCKHGFHLHFPYLFLSRGDLESHLIPRVRDAVRELEVFADLGIEDSGKTVDEACVKNAWLLYGSRKSEELQPYKVTKVFDANGTEISLEAAFKKYQLYDEKERLIPIRGKVEKYLPRILSIISYNREVKELKKGLPSPLKKQIEMRSKMVETRTKVTVTEALKLSAKLLPLLAEFRAEDRNEWMSVGWALHTIGEGCSEALDQWLEFSSRATDKFDEAICVSEWQHMVKKDLTMGTLRYFASVDNPERYKEIKQEEADSHVKDSLSGSHNDIAKVLYAMYGQEFVCASVANRVWFQFRDHCWEEIEEGVFLSMRISGEVVDKYTNMGSEAWGKLASADDKGEEAMYNERMKQAKRMVLNLKTRPFKANVMKECSEVFYDRRFRDKLDMNPYLIAFKNGVYDLQLNIFRPGRPEDFISKAMPIDYLPYDEGDDEVLQAKKYFEQVFPDRSVRDYFLTMASDLFVGGNTKKVILFWTGEGDNAKSVTQKIFELMLGDLAIKFNTTLLTGKKVGNGSANPELARAGRHVRWATLEEPDADEQLNIGLMKILSGGDSYLARDLFEKGKATREITPQFKMNFICNSLPDLRYSDKATWNRIRVVPFESTFVHPDEPCPETYEEQLRQKRFPMDQHFSKKLPELLTAFAWYLLQHRIKNNGVQQVDPPKVRQATAIYRKQNDVYRQFVDENIKEADDGTINMLEMYSTFKEWFKEGFPNRPLALKNEVKKYFEKQWGEISEGAKWKGYRLKTLQDDVANGDAVIFEEEDLVNYEDDGKALPPDLE
jgi:P4 family phage/plasmid primase-like protien